MFFRIQALFLLLSWSLFAEELAGRVVRVADGDTITILDPARTQYKIRLQGIDAPEKGQPFGRASGRFLACLVAGRNVKIQWSKKDKYGRILGTVFLDNRDINLEMLQAGFAWHYKRFDSTTAYTRAETEARAAKRGLWQDKNPVEPHEYRKACDPHGLIQSMEFSRPEYWSG